MCIKKNLNQGLQTASKIISSGNTLPILNNLLLKTEKGRLRISSTNLEIAINTWVGGKVEEEGEITVPAKLVNEYVNNLISEKITLSTLNQNLLLEGENAQTHIKGLPAEEFPLIPETGEKIYTKLDGENLQAIINQVSFATAYTETQPEISGVLFSFSESSLTLVATDRYRLAEGTLPLTQAVSEPKDVIIPSRAVNEINRIVSDGAVEVFLKEGQVCFRTEETELISRLIEGQYPDYKQIIPKTFTSEAEIERVSLIQSLKAASLFASENNNVEMEFDPQDKRILIKSQSTQVGDSVIRLPANFEGGKNTITFNHRYILDCLNNLTDEKVVLKIINPASPAAITPKGRQNYLYIVMPIKI